MITNETDTQLELGFNGLQTRIYGKRREARMARGQWWFARMRAVVAGAMDWQAEAEPRSEQFLFSGVKQFKA